MSLGKSCPDCGSAIGKSAYKCRCGWRMDAPQSVQVIDCFNHPHCMKPAIVRVEKKSFCYDCQLAEHTERAKEFCRSKGLNTRAQMVAWCKGLGMDLPIVEREPGQDDEERAAA